MTLITADSFNDGLIGVKNTFTQKGYVPYTSYRTLELVGGQGRRGGKALCQRISGGYQGDDYRSFLGYIDTANKSAEMYVGFAYKPTNSSQITDYLPIFALCGDSGTTEHVLIDRRTNDLRIRTDTNFHCIIKNAFTEDTWAYWEFYVKLSDTVGKLIVIRDGVLLAQVSNIDTKNGGTDPNFDSCYFYGSGVVSGATANNFGKILGAIADFYWANASGSYNNYFLGDLQVDAYVPSGAGNFSQFSPGVDNYSYVASSDGAGISAATTGKIDTYQFDNLASGTVFGVTEHVVATDYATSSRKMRNVVRIGGVNYNGTDISLSRQPGHVSTVWPTSPATSALWTVSEFNSAEFGMETRS